MQPDLFLRERTAQVANQLVSKIAAGVASKPWWLKVLIVFGATRLLSFSFFLLFAEIQGDNYWTSARPGYFDFLNIWDAEWYERIYDHGLGGEPGYSRVLPLDDAGNVRENAWAFMPGFPLLIRGLNILTGVEWKYLAPLTSTLLSLILALVLFKIFSLKLSESTSLWAVLLFGLSPAAPVLQTGYAETLGLLLLALAIFQLMHHRYLAALPFLVLLSITRPGMVAFAMMLGGMWLVRYYKFKRGQVDFPVLERVKLAGLTVVSGLLGFSWYLFAGWYTGRPDAYLATELAWRFGYTQKQQLVPVEGWFIATSYQFGPVLGPVLVVLAVGAAVQMMFSEPIKALGSELRLWLAGYLFYLLLVFFPQSSTLRILLPAFPIFGALAVLISNRSRGIKTAVVVALVIGQLVWLDICWLYASPDFTPP